MAVAEKLDFINPNAGPPPRPSISTELGAVWRNVWTIMGWFLGITVFSAALFYIGSPHGWGIRPTFSGPEEPLGASPAPGFLDCLYFSVVTITTLGYGDYRPESFGRIAASIEVVAGIVLMGVFVSRLVSQQLNRVARRLLKGQLNAEAQTFREKITANLELLRAHPGFLVPHTESSLLDRTSGLVQSIARYWRFEAQEPELAELLQVRAAGRLVGDLIEVLEIVAAEVRGKTRAALHPGDLRSIRNITESTLLVATVLLERVPDKSLAHSYERVAALVTEFRENLELHKIE
jgi:Ion channel